MPEALLTSPLKPATSEHLPAAKQRRFTLMRPAMLVCLVLGALVWLVFGQAVHFDFINFDDPVYVCDNPAIKAGLSWRSIWWLMTHSNVNTWFPLTDISHQLDWELFGANAGGHHLTNVLLHAATAMLLFCALLELTKAFWRSAFTSALFAVHPLRAESVAWVVERKDVLCGLFFALTLLTWAYHVRKSPRVKALADDPGRFTDFFSMARWTPAYGMALIFFTLGLASKTVLVTLPLLLLALDFWPLQRLPARPLFSPRTLRHITGLIVEKVPFLIVSAVFCLITLKTQGKMVSAANSHSIFLRIGNGAYACADYLLHTVWPAGLTVCYTTEQTYPTLGRLIWAATIFTAITIAAIATRKGHPYLLTGWIWYLLLLLPVIDIMQVSVNAHADRYTYLPHIGLCLMGVWGISDISATWQHRRLWLGGIGISLVAVLSIAAHRQVSFWKDSVTLWSRAIECTSNNYFARNYLGGALSKQENWPEAIQHYRLALQINPDYPEAMVNLGVALMSQGDQASALQLFERARQIDPQCADACYNLGKVLAERGDFVSAITNYNQALQINPSLREARNRIVLALACLEKWDEATSLLENSLGMKLDPAHVRFICGVAFANDKNWRQAVTLYQAALQIRQEFPEAHYRLGIALHHLGQSTEAIGHLNQALAQAEAAGQTEFAASVRKALAACQQQPAPPPQ